MVGSEHSAPAPHDHVVPSEEQTATEYVSGDQFRQRNSRSPNEGERREPLSFGGEKVEIDWKFPPRSHRTEVEPPFLDDFTRLRELVDGGDSSAAMDLYEIVRFCSTAYVSEEELDRAVELAYQTRRIHLPDTQSSMRVAEVDDIEAVIDSELREPFKYCDGIDIYERSNAGDWLETAASLGNSLASIELGRSIADTDYDKSLAYLHKAWQQGNTDALPFLAKLYGTSYQSGEFPENKIKAYSIYYAFNYILQEGSQGHGEIFGRWAAEQRRNLELVEDTLYEHEIEEGRRAARDLIISNENCCYGF